METKDIDKLRGISRNYLTEVKDFNLAAHIVSIFNKYDYPTISPIQKKLISINIKKNQGLILNRLNQDNGFARSREQIYFPQNSIQHIEGCKYLEEILNRFCDGPNSINQEIRNLRQQRKISFRIIQNEKADAFATTKDDGSREIAFQAGMFTQCDAGTIALVLGHELGHIIEQQARPPQGKIPGINCKAVELFCDIVGKSVAEGAGYDTSQFSSLLKMASSTRNQDDSNDDHPSATNRLKTLENISAGSHNRSNTVPPILQQHMKKENWTKTVFSNQTTHQRQW